MKITPKEFLLKYKWAKARCDELTASVERIEATIDAVAINYNGMPHGSGTSDRVGKQAIQLAMLKEKRKEELAEAELIAQEIENVILAVADPRYQTVLRYRYIDLMTWTDIADAMGYEVSHVSGRLHGSALMEVKELLDTLQ